MVDRDIDITKIITYNCADSARRLLASREHGRPACARQHPGLIDGAYCSAVSQKEVEAEGRKYLCQYIGKPVGMVTGKRVIYACDAALDLARDKRLRKLPSEKADYVKPAINKEKENKDGFWARLFGL